MLQVALGLVGLVYVAMIYPLYTDLAHSKWLPEMKDACDPMFLSWFIALGPFSAAGCQKAVVALLADYLRRVPELGPCFGNDHPNCGSMAFIGILRMLSFSASSGGFCWHSHPQDDSRAQSLPSKC